MARKIIILDEILDSSDLLLNYAMWLDVPEARRVVIAEANATSVVKDATAAELEALRTGEVIEVASRIGSPKGTDISVVKAKLETLYNAQQTELNNKNAYKFYGEAFNGTAWIEGGLQ